jgi:hypothetical protein
MKAQRHEPGSIDLLDLFKAKMAQVFLGKETLDMCLGFSNRLFDINCHGWKLYRARLDSGWVDYDLPMRIPRLSFFLALACLGSISSSTAFAQSSPCSTPGGDTGFAEIAVNVNAGTFNTFLPFDVPIRLCGAAGADISKVQVLYAEGRAPVQLNKATCKSQDPTLLRGGPSMIDGQAFRVVIPRLAAQRFYAFCFLFEKAVTPDQARQFATKARGTLDQALRQVESADLSEAQSARLRDDLRSDLLQILETDEILSQGTLFDATVPHGQVKGDFSAKTAAVLEPQGRLRGILQGQAAPGAPSTTSFSTLQFDLRQQLDAVRTSGALSRFVQTLENAAQNNVNLATLLQNEYADELALAKLSDDQAAQKALGLPEGGGPDLTTSADPNAAAEIAASFEKLSETLSNPDLKKLGLDELINDALGQGLLSSFVAALSPADRDELKALAAGPIARASSRAFALAGQAGNARRALQSRAAALDDLVQTVQIATADVKTADASTTSGDFKTAQSNYISADTGLLAAPAIDEVVPYAGTNIYFRPVNKNAPLRSLGTFGQTFTRRFALTLGLTASSIQETEDMTIVRDDLFSSQSLVIGAGLRLTDSIRLGAGALVFKEDDPSPLIDDLSVTASYYVSISFDMDIVGLLKGINKVLPAN